MHQHQLPAGRKCVIRLTTFTCSHIIRITTFTFSRRIRNADIALTPPAATPAPFARTAAAWRRETESIGWRGATVRSRTAAVAQTIGRGGADRRRRLAESRDINARARGRRAGRRMMGRVNVIRETHCNRSSRA